MSMNFKKVWLSDKKKLGSCIFLLNKIKFVQEMMNKKMEEDQNARIASSEILFCMSVFWLMFLKLLENGTAKKEIYSFRRFHTNPTKPLPQQIQLVTLRKIKKSIALAMFISFPFPNLNLLFFSMSSYFACIIKNMYWKNVNFPSRSVSTKAKLLTVLLMRWDFEDFVLLWQFRVWNFVRIIGTVYFYVRG